ncbi:hypothetical protein PCANC_16650 [Puccinia coronata f. sp. avenae]|uniref:Uncharacterized protein n=1 Tax=Puccinia coronata f. sp. avenae TaxID=200324 RepID=A0A2N5T3U5_9BASI|nr:hypothetical protein PCANC_16650 [Puccinia coronata f. sp. avenae]
MAASELTSDAAIQFKLGRRATDLIENRFKHGCKTPGPLSLNRLSNDSVARRPSLNRMAASDVKLDAAIRCSFAGSANHWSDHSSSKPVRQASYTTGQTQWFNRCLSGQVQPVARINCLNTPV